MRFHAHVVEYVCQLPGVDATVVGDVLLAALVHVEVADLALQSLSDQPVQKGPAVVAERETVVVLHRESVGHVDLETNALKGLQKIRGKYSINSTPK